MKAGMLYIIATPIGNIEDLTPRAAKTLAQVDLIAAEDTRHTQRLLANLGLEKPLWSLHDHNEHSKVAPLIEQLQAGKNVGLVSDAGTPLISDPGFVLVRAAHLASIRVVPIPGACAAIAALSVAGLPSDHFSFMGFLPRKSTERRTILVPLVAHPHTLIFYESPHRLDKTLEDLIFVFGGNRPCTLGRELTKTYEQVWQTTLTGLLEGIQQGTVPLLGEIVLVVAGSKADDEKERQALKVLALLQTELPLSKAVHLTAQITGISKNWLYDAGLTL